MSQTTVSPDLGPNDPRAGTAGRSVDLGDLCDSISRVAGRAARQLSLGLQRLSESGRLTESEHKTLMRYVTALGEAAQSSQQIRHLDRGRFRRALETVDLESVLRDAVAERADLWSQAGVELRMHGQGASISADPPLVRSLIGGMLQWAGLNGRKIRCRLDVDHVQSVVKLIVKASTAPRRKSELRAATADVAWHLITQLALSTGAAVDRISADDGGVLTMQIGPLVKQFEGLTTVEMDDAIPAKTRMMGKVVVVLGESQAFRVAVRDALRNNSFDVESVGSVRQLREAILYKTPAAIVVAQESITPEFESVRQQLLLDMGTFAFIEVYGAAGGNALSGPDSDRYARLSIDDLQQSLVPLLSFEIAKSA